MNHVIIGTAGHIDHGKTSLIKALTNIDTDRLKEEKKRGISIDLGFAYFDLPSGRRAGIVDVPGHEKFIKKMIAGAAGIDVVIMVVAADEGVMPQTIEHLNILSFLEIQKGIVVVTKKDLVDGEWLQLVIEDIREHLKGSFLEDAPVIPVSAKTGEGLNEVVQKIDEITAEIKPKDVASPFRLPIDRVFTLTGFGTVVTGTLITGKIKKDDTCEILPKGLKARIRNIQVHGRDVEIAEAGQRTALNLTGVKTEEISRGDIVAAPNYLKATRVLDAKMQLLKDAKKALKSTDPIRISIGSKEVTGRVKLLDCKTLEPGKEAFVQLFMDEAIAALYKDRYVVRSYSPVFTIGGGEILNPLSKRKKAFDSSTILDLKIRSQYPIKDVMEHVIKIKSKNYPDKTSIIQGFARVYECMKSIEKLKEEGRVIEIDGSRGIIIHKNWYKEMMAKILNILDKYHQNNPLKKGMNLEELREKLDLMPGVLEYFVSELTKLDKIVLKGHLVSLKGFEINFNEPQRRVKQLLEKAYLGGTYKPPKLKDLVKAHKLDEKQSRKVFEALIDLGVLVKIDEDIVFHREHFIKARQKLIQYLKQHQEISLSQFRDLLDTSRKYALPLLEYFDKIGLTKRIGDNRVLDKDDSQQIKF